MTAEEYEPLRVAVEAALDAQRPGTRVGNLRVLEGGRSGVTLVAETSSPNVADEDVVIKAAPTGRAAVGRHDVARQARVIAMLAGVDGVIVPAVLAVGTQPVHFFVMSRSVGEAVEPVLDAAHVHLSAEVVHARAMRAAHMLAALHAVEAPPRQPDGLEEPVQALAEEVARWRKTAEAADPEILRGGVELAALLDSTAPTAKVRTTLVHGDFRLGNIVFDGTTPTGLIDWEIWGHTDPGVDIGWFLVFCDPTLFPGIGQPVDGMPSGDELMQAYRSAGGQEIAHREWYEAFGRFKMAAIMAHNLRRHREGRHVDPFQEKLPPTIAQLVDTGTALLSG